MNYNKGKERANKGEFFVKEGIRILKEKGYTILKISKRNESYDLITKFKSQKVYIEIKGLSQKGDGYFYNFNINYGKLQRLKELNNLVFFLFITPEGHALVNLKDLNKNKNNFSINNRRIIIGISRTPKSTIMINRKSISLDSSENSIIEELSNKLKISKRETIKFIINDWNNKNNLL